MSDAKRRLARWIMALSEWARIAFACLLAVLCLLSMAGMLFILFVDPAARVVALLLVAVSVILCLGTILVQEILNWAARNQ